MKKHATHFYGCPCEAKLIKDLIQWLEIFHKYEKENGGCVCCGVLDEAKKRIDSWIGE